MTTHQPLADFFNHAKDPIGMIALKPPKAERFADVQAIDFGDGLVIKLDKRLGAIVFGPGGEIIAGMRPLNMLYVAEDYRGKGYASKMIYMFMRMFPDYRPSHIPTRNPFGTRAYQSAWRKLVADGIIAEDAVMPVPTMGA
jgi:GNAT superfamily N-acetyltransferase